MLYAGTETGVYVSFDDGDNWQTLQLNLPVVSVHDLAVHGNDLVAATHGRAFWVLDDLTPLQQMTEETFGSDVVLFKPVAAVRIRRSENNDTPLPPEEPQGTNPPGRSDLDYFFKSAPRGQSLLRSLIKGETSLGIIRVKIHPPADTIPQTIVDYWFPTFEQLTANVGHNRFIWGSSVSPPLTSVYDYGAGVANLKSDREPEGPLVPPGKYEVRLSCDGHTYSQPLEVVMDPRVKIADAAVKDQPQAGNRIVEHYFRCKCASLCHGHFQYLAKRYCANREA